jgi:hypothetical protein
MRLLLWPIRWYLRMLLATAFPGYVWYRLAERQTERRERAAGERS